MKGILKVCVFCFVVAFFWNMAATQQLSIYTQATKEADEKQPRDILLACGLTGHWATIARFNKSNPDARGFEPNYTVIFCKYKPVVKKVGQRWQITFTSEIAEDIP